MPAAATTLKIPQQLKARIVRLAKNTARTPHGLMLEAIAREVEREERHSEFVAVALAADRGIDRGDPVYAAQDVHAWLNKLAAGKKATRPRVWRR